MTIMINTDLSECSNQVLADVHSNRNQLLSVGTNYLLHHRGEVIILRLSDDLQQLQRYLSDLRLEILLGQVSLA